jgi:hypothetical protein
MVGHYSEYLNKQMSFPDIERERKKQLAAISQIRGGRDILVYASDLKGQKKAPVGIDYSDILPFQDQLAQLSGSAIDIVLETPGGQAEVVEDLVRIIRNRYENVGVIVPGWAKSAGTIFAMAADEILMGPTSALGPIDAQIQENGNKFVSAEEYLDGLDAILQEVHDAENKLNAAYIPILQNMTPGYIQHCRNAQLLSSTLVKQWLYQYKFKNWKTHSQSGLPVSDQERHDTAEKIADTLCRNSQWLTHARSLGQAELKDIGLQVTDFMTPPELGDSVMRYYTLVQMSFDTTNMYKMFETVSSQIYRFSVDASNAPTKPSAGLQKVNVECPKCKQHFSVQYCLGQATKREAGLKAFPLESGRVWCPKCHSEIDLSDFRRKTEAESGMKFVDFEKE